MSFLFVKNSEDVCNERAKIDASAKFDHIIKEKREEYALTRNVKIMQDIIKLSRQKSKFQKEAFKHHMDNYVMAADSISDKTTESARKASGLKEFSDYLIAELDKI